jgi:aldehyde:ferredoxin oxidoreductase
MGRQLLGFNEADDRLPDFFKLEKLSPHDSIWDMDDAELDGTLKF